MSIFSYGAGCWAEAAGVRIGKGAASARWWRAPSGDTGQRQKRHATDEAHGCYSGGGRFRNQRGANRERGEQADMVGRKLRGCTAKIENQ